MDQDMLYIYIFIHIWTILGGQFHSSSGKRTQFSTIQINVFRVSVTGVLGEMARKKHGEPPVSRIFRNFLLVKLRIGNMATGF